MFYSNKYPKSVFRELQEFPYSKRNRRAIFDSAKASEDLVQRLKLLKKLPIHNGCVNCICWNEKGNKILSGSDDQHLIITDPFSYQILAQYRTNHRANIFSAKFLPNTDDTGIVSCCGDGSIFYTDLSRIDETQDCLFNCHAGTTYDVVTIPNDPNVFLSCGEDYTVRSFDLRVKSKCNKIKCKEDVIIQCRRAVTALTVNSLMPCQIGIGCADSTARIYDRRMVDGVNCRLSPVDAFIRPGLERKPYRITSLNFSPEGEDLLVSYSSEHVYLFGLKNSKDMVFSTESLCGSDEEEGGMGVWCSSDKGDSVPVRRLRLRGDWSDTGPDARPHSNTAATASQGGRRVVQGGLIQRMTDVLSRMLNDPATRAALSQGGESEPSDQMQIEEGLGEYLGIDSRRPSEGNSGEAVASSETVEATGQNESNEMVEDTDSSMDQSEVNVDVSSHVGFQEACDVNMDLPAQVNLESSNRLVTEDTKEAPIETVLPSNLDIAVTDAQACTSPSQPTPETEVQSETSMFMETEDVNHRVYSSTASHSLADETCKEWQSNNLCTDQLLEDDEDISPVKRVKDERLSPFDEDTGKAASASQDITPVIRTEDLAPGNQTPEQTDKLSRYIGLQDWTGDPPSNLNTDANSQNRPSPSSNPDAPSTSQPQEEERVYATTSRNTNFSDLTHELSSMFNGFKQKYGASGGNIPEITPQGPDSSQEIREVAENRVNPSEELRSEPSASTSSSTLSDPLPSSSSYTSTKMEKELSKAIRNARGESNQDETIRLKKANIRMKYTGHRNARTMIKEATFWGSDYVMSGSDCGHVFIWTRDTGRLVMTLQADNHVVNCLQPHPTLPILATSGIDYDLKLWAPLAPEPVFDFPAAQELMNRNAIMLEETKDTITVPASFMIRMLACLNQLRRGGLRAVRRRRVPHE